MIHSGVLLREQVAQLQKANEAATKRKERKKNQIQKRGTLTKAEGEDIIAQKDVKDQLKGEMRQGRAKAGVSRQAAVRCTLCRKTGHNSRTCKKDSIDCIIISDR